MANYKIYADGAAGRKHARWGFVVYHDGELFFQHMGSVLQNPSTVTNNTTEYCALCFALTWILSHCEQDDEIDVCLDSKLVIEQVEERWKVNSDHLRPFHVLAKDSLMYCQRKTKRIDLVWIGRKKNLADNYIKGTEVPDHDPQE
jgi:ribonuclease HI